MTEPPPFTADPESLNNRYTCVLWNRVPRDWEVIVLHDLPTGTISQLPHFLTALRELGAEVVQEFPPTCVPPRAGQLVPPVEHLVSNDPDRP